MEIKNQSLRQKALKRNWFLAKNSDYIFLTQYRIYWILARWINYLPQVQILNHWFKVKEFESVIQDLNPQYVVHIDLSN